MLPLFFCALCCARQATATSFCFWALSRMRMLALGKKLKVEADAQV